MSTIRAGTGLVSGLDINGLVNSLITLQSAPIQRLQDRTKDLQTTQTGISTLEATVVAITTSIQHLAASTSFNTFNNTVSDSSQLAVRTGTAASPGTYNFQAIQKASTFAVR